MKRLAIIPARGGSKRIVNKNIKSFLGRPMISYSIEIALNSNLFDEVMVSTDSEIIAETAIEYGATVPFMRSHKNADDHSTTGDVIQEVLLQYRNELNRNFTQACCVYPTAVLMTKDHLEAGLSLLNKNKYSTVFPIIKYGHPIERSLHITDKGKVNMVWPENKIKRTQDFIPKYHDAGQFYWFDVNDFLSSGQLMSENSGGIILSLLEAQDIDNEDDWKMAEIKYKTNYGH